MQKTLRKIFIVSAILTSVFLVFFAIYLFAFRSGGSSTVSDSSSDQTISDSQTDDDVDDSVGSQQGVVRALTTDSVLSAVFDSETDTVLYYATDGRVLRIDSDGRVVETVAAESFSGLVEAHWSPDGQKTITRVRTDQGERLFVRDQLTQTSTPLREGIDFALWTHDGTRILYKFYDDTTKERSLNVSFPDGSDWRKLADLPYRLVSVQHIPQSSLVSFWNFSDGFQETQMSVVGIAGGDARTVFTSRFGADYLWSPDGTMALVSSTVSRGEERIALGVINENGGQYRDLGAPTIASKCVWSFNAIHVYCAFPASVPPGSVMPNDYLSEQFMSRDTFWKIHVATGKKERVVELDEFSDVYDATNLFLSSSEDVLFFVNRVDGLLYGIDL